ncbi:hypothetical protein [Sphaerochaeta sp. PS]|jgi:Tfp pilus assembly protein PilX|uniref:hypothetical protein n=1 Tax=Sphaerochaeta sp. PS TaxID=3076336 RepID=UPI0028A53293|nr:hypothetical protein [Sphaerochaeta sp. PS]MDT4761662.1 hypothetical protein [Sphaerochaeta sp. PS]
MKSNHKKSNRMLVVGAIFLVVYLLASVVFGSFMLDQRVTNNSLNRSVTYSSFSVRHGF